MRDALDQLASQSIRLLNAPQGEVQTSALSTTAAPHRAGTATRLLRALDAMAPDASEQLLKLAEAFAVKHPAAPRLHLVRVASVQYQHKELPNG
jgi:hypothetical protein